MTRNKTLYQALETAAELTVAHARMVQTRRAICGQIFYEENEARGSVCIFFSSCLTL